MIWFLTKRVIVREINKTLAECGRLSRRMALLQMGHNAQMFEEFPELEKMASSGLKTKTFLTSIIDLIEEGKIIDGKKVGETLVEMNDFIKNSHQILDFHDHKKATEDKFFVVHNDIKGLF